jgi:hypothetical protein
MPVAEMAELIRPGGKLDHHDCRRCRERTIEGFASDRMVEKHEKLFQSILSAPARPGSRHQEGRWAGDSQFLSSPGN